MTPSRRPLALCTLACLLPLAASAELRTPESADIDAIFTNWNGTQNPGCSLGVYQDAEILLARGYGMANLEYNIANAADTVFRIGSTSKQFAAMAMAILDDTGQLSLDDDIRKFFPDMPEYGAPVTIRHLVHHT